MERSAICARALQILAKTGEGKGLHLRDYHLIENVIQGNPSANEVDTLTVLYSNVMDGKYQQNWVQDIQGLTMDNDGHVYYLNKFIAKYTDPTDSKIYADLLELQNRCRHLEAIYADINETTVRQRWGVLSELNFGDPYITVICRHYKLVSKNNRVLLFMNVHPFGSVSRDVVCARFNGEDWMFSFRKNAFELNAYINSISDLPCYRGIDTQSMDARQLTECFSNIGVPYAIFDSIHECLLRIDNSYLYKEAV